MVRTLFILAVGASIGYVYGYKDAKTHDKTIVERTLDRAGAAADQTTSQGLAPSGFDAWVAAQRAKGALRTVVDPFPPAAVAFSAR